MKKAFIIGAAPAGLTAAYELLKQSDEYEVTVFEESFHMGGISKTVNYKGNRMDMGGSPLFLQGSGSKCMVGTDASHAGGSRSGRYHAAARRSAGKGRS